MSGLPENLDARFQPVLLSESFNLRRSIADRGFSRPEKTRLAAGLFVGLVEKPGNTDYRTDERGSPYDRIPARLPLQLERLRV
ncbi:hypothetical protein Y029_5867 [Burkholderia pseudomallei MSHR303]|nr:hypothetical protein BDL_4904 [Burkholderia pseudomallei MSHR305]AGZ31197.1 hypothetical protein BBK_4207 [Burkholderia pseudomallei NCTC 13179]AHK68001.1 hypothetical protein BBX_4066 [Burkholderia pseudomallei MSHR520]AIP82978.1 hypothetical protein JE55_6063 [Burkholderia pseudomallei]KGU90735.1 hypothetical protein X880_3605 [Burkholderia pseudomallei MSHR4032]KGV17660.1 hypothetical protein X895_3642 [Burkholderia pseudomallei MSHR4503]KGW00125.1 hypothetical protein X897_6104 [Burkho